MLQNSDTTPWTLTLKNTRGGSRKSQVEFEPISTQYYD